jgi:hypothetical protein
VNDQLVQHRQSLRTYLNHHLSRAAAVTVRARGAAARARGTLARRLAALAKDFDDDRQALLTFMARLGVRVPYIRMLADRFAARAADLLRRRHAEPDSLTAARDIEELQAGVQRKISSWEVLRAQLGSTRDDRRQLDRLLTRAQRQLAELGQLHREAAASGTRPRRHHGARCTTLFSDEANRPDPSGTTDSPAAPVP